MTARWTKITQIALLAGTMALGACGSDQGTDFFDRPALTSLFRVVSNTPLNGDTNVAGNQTIVFNMSEPVDPNTLIENIRIEEMLPGSSASQLVDFRVEPRNRETSIVITPNRQLVFDATYTVILTTGIRSMLNEPLYLDATLRFYTGAGTGIPSGVISKPGGPKLMSLSVIQNPPYPCLAFMAEFNEDLSRMPLVFFKVEQEAIIMDINLANGFMEAFQVTGDNMRRFYVVFPADYSGCTMPVSGIGTRVLLDVREAFDLQGEFFDRNGPAGSGGKFDWLDEYL